MLIASEITVENHSHLQKSGQNPAGQKSGYVGYTIFWLLSVIIALKDELCDMSRITWQ